MSLHIPGTPNVRTDLPLPAPACEIGRMDHCWHREGSPTREARKGAKQVRCCFCDATGWAVMRRNTGPACGDSPKVLEKVHPEEVVAFEPRQGAAL